MKSGPSSLGTGDTGSKNFFGEKISTLHTAVRTDSESTYSSDNSTIASGTGEARTGEVRTGDVRTGVGAFVVPADLPGWSSAVSQTKLTSPTFPVVKSHTYALSVCTATSRGYRGTAATVSVL